MLEKLYELWSIEKRVSVTIKSVGLNCTFTTVIENIYKGEDSVVLEFGDNNMKLDVVDVSANVTAGVVISKIPQTPSNPITFKILFFIIKPFSFSYMFLRIPFLMVVLLFIIL